MSGVAIITDIHANLPALQASLRRVDELGIDCGCSYITPHDRELGQQSVVWTLEQRPKDFMRELPFDLRVPVGDHEIHLVHGSPRAAFAILQFADKLVAAA